MLPMESSIIELATKTRLVNKSKRQISPVVLQCQQLADAIRGTHLSKQAQTARFFGIDSLP